MRLPTETFAAGIGVARSPADRQRAAEPHRERAAENLSRARVAKQSLLFDGYEDLDAEEDVQAMIKNEAANVEYGYAPGSHRTLYYLVNLTPLCRISFSLLTRRKHLDLSAALAAELAASSDDTPSSLRI